MHREKPEQTNAADGQSPGNKEKPGKNESLVKSEDAAKRSQGIGSESPRCRKTKRSQKPEMEPFGQFDKQDGMDIPVYMAYIRAQSKKAGPHPWKVGISGF